MVAVLFNSNKTVVATYINCILKIYEQQSDIHIYKHFDGDAFLSIVKAMCTPWVVDDDISVLSYYILVYLLLNLLV